MTKNLITEPLDTFFPSKHVEETADILQVRVFNFKQHYQNRLDEFLTWQTVRDDIYQAANNDIVMAVYSLPAISEKVAQDNRTLFTCLCEDEPGSFRMTDPPN